MPSKALACTKQTRIAIVAVICVVGRRRLGFRVPQAADGRSKSRTYDSKYQNFNAVWR